MLDRRLAEMERLVENKHRLGHIEDVKFDDKNKRWLVKFRDGPAPKQQQGGSDSSGGSSGGDSGQGGGASQGGDSSQNRTVMTDWIPWSSHSSGTIKFSVPPKKGQKVQCHSPNGRLEHATVSPFSYGQGTESPHDKQDEVYFRIEKDTSQSNSGSSSSTSSSTSSGSTSSPTTSQQTNNEQLNFHATKDGFKTWIGNASLAMTANSIVGTMAKHTLTINDDGIALSVDDGKSTLKLTKDSIKALSDLLESKSTDGSAKVTIDNSGVDTQGKKINDG